MRKHTLLVSCVASSIASGCKQSPPPGEQQTTPRIVQAEGKGEGTKPRVGPNPGLPVETSPPNVPEFKPAFSGQTRAPAIHTRATLTVSEIAKGFDSPWALEFLPDRRMLVTEKHDGK